MKEKKARVEDALHATRAAVEEGIVAGGGVALIRARAAAEKVKGDNDDQNAGIKIIVRALEEPLRAIALNAGDDPLLFLTRLLSPRVTMDTMLLPVSMETLSKKELLTN